MKTEKASGHFNSGTVATLWRNGVLLKCWGPSCTWHDDDCVEQKIEGPNEVEFNVVGLCTETESFSEFPGVTVDRKQFAEACKRMGCTYTRTVK